MFRDNLFKKGFVLLLGFLLLDGWIIATSNEDDLFMNKIRSEICELEKGQLPLRVLGIVHANRKLAPLLNGFVSDIAGNTGMSKPMILVFRGNLLNDALVAITGGIIIPDMKLNAFASGITVGGKTIGLICIGKDFIDGMTKNELSGIIAHECGHLKHNHIVKGMLFLTLIYILKKMNVFSGEDNIYSGIDLDRFDVSMRNKVLLVIANMLTGGLLDHYKLNIIYDNDSFYVLKTVGLFYLFEQYLSRVHEYQADLSAAKSLNDPEAMKQGLVKLYELVHNKHSLVYYYMKIHDLPVINFASSHPSLDARLKHIDKYKVKLKTEDNLNRYSYVN